MSVSSRSSQQATLVRAQLLATLGKLVPFVPSDFVCELLNDGLITVDFLAHHVDLRQQLRGQCAQLLSCQLVEIGRGVHAADCARADALRRYTDGLMAGATALRGGCLASENLPWFNRRAASQIPTPSCTRTFMRLARRIGEQIGAVRLRRTEHRHHAGQRGFSARAHIHGFGGEPDTIDTDHWASPRTKRAHPSGSEAGHFTVIDCSPSGSSIITAGSTGRFGVSWPDGYRGLSNDLVSLSQTRQVIIFTHRLSLVALVDAVTEKWNKMPGMPSVQTGSDLPQEAGQGGWYRCDR
ncbi:hypothetical protein L1887_40661 [Cichorium endivia]|nr:hypothetical protein L1887_40661 [Cichorium endivia]